MGKCVRVHIQLLKNDYEKFRLKKVAPKNDLISEPLPTTNDVIQYQGEIPNTVLNLREGFYLS